MIYGPTDSTPHPADEGVPGGTLPSRYQGVFVPPGGPYGMPSFDDGSADEGGGLGRILHSLRRRWLPVFFVGSLCAVAGAAAGWFGQTTKYTTSAILQVSPHDDRLSGRGAQVPGTVEAFREHQQALAVAPHVLNRAMRNPEVEKLPEVLQEPDAVAWLGQNVRASFQGESEFLRITMTGTNPKGTAVIVNAVTTAYLEESGDVESARQRQHYDDLKKTLSKKEEELRRRKSNLFEMTAEVGDGRELNPLEQATLADYQSLQEELRQNEYDLREVQYQLRAYEPTTPEEDSGEEQQAPVTQPAVPAAEPELTIPENELQTIIDQDEIVVGLRKSIEHSEYQIQVYLDRMDAGAAAGYVRVHEQRIQRDQIALKERAAEIKQLILDRMRSTSQPGVPGSKTHELVVELKRRMQILQMHREHLEEASKQLHTILEKAGNENQAGNKLVEAEILKGEIEVLETSVAKYRFDVDEMETILERNADPKKIAPIRLVSDAPIPKVVDYKAKLPITGLAGGMGFLLPAVLLVWLDARKQKINSPVDATRLCRTELLGSVPRLPASRMLNPFGWRRRERQWVQRLTEAVDSIAIMLAHKSELEDRHVFMVSSAMAGEGKTTLSTHLAISLAATGRRTLLIDFDLRRPSLDEIFNVPLQPGICEVFRGEFSLEKALRPTETYNLTLMTAGFLRDAILKELTQGRLAQLFKELRSRFDFIVVDGSPILPIVDTRLIGQHVDGVILSLLRDVSQVPKVLQACDILRSFRIPLIGTVLTGTSEEVYYSKSAPGIEDKASPGALVESVAE